MVALQILSGLLRKAMQLDARHATALLFVRPQPALFIRRKACLP
jgi:hypothetical protein